MPLAPFRATLLRLGFTSAALLACGGAADRSSLAPVPPRSPFIRDSIVVTPTTLSISKGAYIIVVARTYDHSGNRVQTTGMSWTTDNDLVAYVPSQADTIANVLGRSVGTTTLTATFTGRTTRVPITVSAPKL